MCGFHPLAPAKIPYTYDGDDIAREVTAAGTRRYVHGRGVDEPLAVDVGGGFSYLHADGLGSITATTNDVGVVALSRQYDSWGSLEVGAIEPGFAFTGREWDAGTGLHYYRARYFDSTIGRFTSEDPLGFKAGVGFYTYAANNPVNLIDPQGLDTQQCSRDMRNMPGSGRLPKHVLLASTTAPNGAARTARGPGTVWLG